MLVWISWIVVGIIYNLFHCYLFLKLSDSSEKLFNKKIIFLSIFFSLLNCYVVYHGMYIRPIVVHVCYVLILLLAYRVPLSKAITGILLIACIISFSEMLTGIILSTILKINLVEFNHTAIGVITCNIFCLILSLFFINIKTLKKFMKSFFKWCIGNQIFTTILLLTIAIIATTVLLRQNILKWNSISDLVVTNTFILFILAFVLIYLKENSDRNKLVKEYDVLLAHVKTYEKLIIEKSKSQHEYRNQLILLKGLISSNNKKAINYIDEILNLTSNEINYDWLIKLNNIPQGGLKGLLYYKVSQMQEKHIESFIDISHNLENISIWEQCETYLKDVSCIIGVYIDNAIEAASKSIKKYIIIEAELIDGNIVFTFSNTYSGSLDVSNIDGAGFTTKGKGKGYGLSLVNDILKKNTHLRQEREFNGIYFVQRLIVLNK